MVMETLRVISRNSPLAKAQVALVFDLLPALAYEVSFIPSYGDVHKHLSLLDGQPDDFFTRELDLALLAGEADVAIHSAKDLPYPLAEGLAVFALTQQADPTDSLVSLSGYTLASLPPNARVGTSSPQRRDQLLAVRPDLQIVSLRGAIGERLEYLRADLADAIVVATCALQRLSVSSFRCTVLPFETHPMQGILAVIGRAGNIDIKKLFLPVDDRQRYGQVCLAGFGPGDPDLITVKAIKRLREADVIVYDDLLEASLLRSFTAEKLYAGKRRGQHSMNQDAINRLLLNKARKGLNVVRLKGGDPFVFGRGGEEMDYLRRCYVDIEIVPGISAAIGAAASSGIPLTHRGLSASVSFQTAHNAENIRFTGADTQVFYMGSYTLADILEKAHAQGLSPDTPVALIHSATLPDEQVYVSEIGALRASGYSLPSPLIVIIGPVARLYSAPGKRAPVILHTGTDASDIVSHGKVWHIPFIEIEPLNNSKEEWLATGNPADYEWIVFTSRYGVNYYFKQLLANGLDLRALSHLKMASVGHSTSAALRKIGLTPDLQPEVESAEGLISIFRQNVAPGSRVLLARSAIGLPALPEGLTTLGYQVTDFPVYNTHAVEPAPTPDLNLVDRVAFASPSAVKSFFRCYPLENIPTNIQFMSKNGATLHEVRKYLANSTFKLIEQQ